MSGRGNRGGPRRGFHSRGRGGGRHGGGGASAGGRYQDGGSSSQSDGWGRPPPHLKGKQIGLWYSMRGAAKRIENLPKIELTEERRGKITQLLKDLDHSSSEAGSSRDSEFLRRYRQNLFDNAQANERVQGQQLLNPELDRVPHLDDHLKTEFERKLESHKYRKMLQFRKRLPAYVEKDKIIKLIMENQVVVISGETGCGKTTQCCQLILDEMIRQGNGSLCNIVCTQPRRISAITVAERVADERDERIGGQTVGYCIRLESRLPQNSRGTILFCTTGVVFQYLKDDPHLSRFTHVVVDEIHERDVLSDFLLAILKNLIKARKDLKVILMSATINAEHFARVAPFDSSRRQVLTALPNLADVLYFGHCPTFNIPGFTYPVDEYYLEDVIDQTRFVFETKDSSTRGPQYQYQGRGRNYQNEDSEYQRMLETHVRQLERTHAYPRQVINEIRKPEVEELNLDLIEALLHHICQTDTKNGAVLIFVPGWDQISKLNTQLQSCGKFPQSRTLVIPLHSLMPTVNQRDVFNRPPVGIRKIIIATNIAETSITIDDIVYVIDTGKIKITNFDLTRNIESLDTEWVSLANSKQRKGRAGRVQGGVCYHLYNKARQMTLESCKKPEVLRKRLTDVILQIKVLRLGSSEAFLRRLLDRPSEKSVQLALDRLIQINALDRDENLTPLGLHLAHLPMDPQTGKMILMAGIFGCVDPILTVAASLSFKDGFYIPLGQEKNVDRIRKELSRDTRSDHMVTVYAMKGYEQACENRRERDFCYRHFLSGNTMQMLVNMKKQFSEHLYEMKFITSTNFKSRETNINSDNLALVKAMICAGLYPNIAQVLVKTTRYGTKTFPKIRTVEDGKVELHPKSVNCGERDYESPYLAYFQKMKSSSIFLYDTTMVSPFALLFFGGELNFKVEKNFGVVSVNHDVKFLIDKSLFELIQALRRHLDKLLEDKVNHPGPTCWDESTKEGALLRAILELITSEYRDLLGEDGYDSGDD